MDTETSGFFFFNEPDPSFNPKTKQTHQSVSWGLIVANAQTFKPIASKYVEIKWNGVSEWNKEAEAVHGLSKEYLEKNGMSEEEAAVEIAEFIDKHWPQDAELSSNRNVRCLGHNVATFDIWFMRRLLKPHGLMFPTGNRFVDSSSVANVVLGVFNSDDMFDELGLGNRTLHNALEDCDLTLKAMQRIRAIFNKATT